MKIRWVVVVLLCLSAPGHAQHSTLPFVPSEARKSSSASSESLKASVPKRREEVSSTLDKVLTQIQGHSRQGFPFPDADLEATLQLLQSKLSNVRNAQLNIEHKALSPEEELVLLDNVEMLVEFSQQLLHSQLSQPSASPKMLKATAAESLRRLRGRDKSQWRIRERTSGSPILSQELKRRSQLFEKGTSETFLDFSKYLQAQWGKLSSRPTARGTNPTAAPAGQPQIVQRFAKRPNTTTTTDQAIDMLLSRVQLAEERKSALTASDEFFNSSKEEVEKIGKNAEERLRSTQVSRDDLLASDPEVR